MPTKQTEAQSLLAGIRSGDGAIISQIYAQYHQAIVHLVETHSGTSDDAHDVFQEGLMVVFQKAKDPNFELSSSFLTYFYAVCRNIWSNKLRKKSSSEVTLDDKVQLMFAEEDQPILEHSEQYFLYRKMFLRLGEDCQKVLRLFLRKVSMEKIMEKMGYGSISYTKKRKFLCKEKLVSLIRNDRSFKELTD